MRRLIGTTLCSFLFAGASVAEESPGDAPPPLSIGGEASFSLASFDHGYFNTTDYRHSLLRMARVSLSAELRAGPRVSLLFEGVSENLDQRVHALYLRLQPLPTRAVMVQAGLIPPVFGAFPRQAYGYDNALIGFPLPYQYLTTLRSDAVPLVAEDLLPVRGRGWRVAYPGGQWVPAPGIPLVSGARWDTGVELRIGTEPIAAGVAVTRGTLSHPRIRDDNEGLQVSARLCVRPNAGLILGASAARGEYLERQVFDELPTTLRGTYEQEALGFDAEYSWGHWLLRGEAVASSWDVPAGASPLPFGPLRSVGFYTEARYRVAPGVSAAARFDGLRFDELQGVTERDTWDSNVYRLEVGVAWTFRRHATLKTVYQHNWRDSVRHSRKGYVAAQLVLWF